MSTLTRKTKNNGTTEFADGDVVAADEHNDEWNQLITDYNGNINDDNIALTAGKLIDSDKINDHSATSAALLTTTSPGTTFSASLATDLRGELERLRYRIRENLVGTNFQAWDKDAADFADMGWVEPKVVGPNILPNSGFELQSGVANSAPDGWTKVGSPTTMAIEAASELDMGADKRSLNIVAAGTGFEGVRYVVAGLKADTKYVVGAAYVRSSDDFVLTTTGGLSTSFDYGNVSFTDDAGLNLQVQNFAFLTDSSGSDITVSFGVSGAIGADANIYQVWLYELSDAAPFETPSLPIQVVKDSTEVAYQKVGAGGWADADHTPLTLSVYVPGPGYIISYEAMLNVNYLIYGLAEAWEGTFDLQMDISGAGYNSVFMAGVDGTNLDATGTNQEYEATTHPTLRHVVQDPAPGSTYTFKIVIGVHNDTGSTNTITLNKIDEGLRQTESRAELELRRI